jgi:DNA-binding NtrC family response regulator
MTDSNVALSEAFSRCRSGVMRQLQKLAGVVGPSTTRVLITGEAGAGKEMLARYLHARSTRAKAPFVAVDCAVQSDDIAYSLFGDASEFAKPRNGSRLQAADRGTLFLDEVSALPLKAQGILLRWLEHGDLPSSRAAEAGQPDVRLLTSTRYDLTTLVRHKRFRADLLMRLKPVEIRVPALREHCEDIRPIVQLIIAQSGRRVTFSKELYSALEQYPWPGNMRELVTMVEQIAWNARGDLADLDDLPGAFHSAQSIPLMRARDRRRQVSDDLFEGLQAGRLGFWTHVHEPFLQRDITREDMRDLIRRGLAESQGSYRSLLRIFGMPDSDYKRLLNFLSAHQCTVDAREFRVAHARA